jgi:hypothetical protein
MPSIFNSQSNLKKYFIISILLCTTLVFSKNNCKNLKPQIYYFISPTCPICIHYIPFLKQIDSLDSVYYTESFCVIPGNYYSEKELENYTSNTTFKKQNIIFDQKYKLVKKLKVTVTPQVICIVNDSIKYSGKIDNAYINIGVLNKQKPIKEYIIPLLDSIHNKIQIQYHSTKPIGCIIKN